MTYWICRDYTTYVNPAMFVQGSKQMETRANTAFTSQSEIMILMLMIRKERGREFPWLSNHYFTLISSFVLSIWNLIKSRAECHILQIPPAHTSTFYRTSSFSGFFWFFFLLIVVFVGFFLFGWFWFLTSKWRCVKMVLTKTACQITLTNLVHVLCRQSTDMCLEQDESGKEGGGKTNAHWLIRGKNSS